MLMDTPRRLTHAPRPLTKATTTPTSNVPLLPEEAAYVKCVDWDDYHIECYLDEVYQKTTELDGVSVDLFMTKKGVKEFEKHGKFEIYYLKEK